MRKLKILIIFLAVAAVLTLVDVVKMNTVALEVVSANPNPAETDPEKPVTLVISLKTKSGKPVEGHNLYAITLGGGSFKSFRVMTDADGNATFTYFPAKIADYQNARDVTVKIRDESNSIFIEMYPSVSYTIQMVKPEQEGESEGLTTDDILGG